MILLIISFLLKLEINKVKYPLTIPSGIDKNMNIIEALAGCGTVTGDKLVGNKADTLVTVLDMYGLLWKKTKRFL